MNDKTQKISEQSHRELKVLAAKEGKSLQEITEEVIKIGIKDKWEAAQKKE